MHADLSGKLVEIPALDIDGKNSTTLCTLLLYGSSQMDHVLSRMNVNVSIAYMFSKAVFGLLKGFNFKVSQRVFFFYLVEFQSCLMKDRVPGWL